MSVSYLISHYTSTIEVYWYGTMLHALCGCKKHNRIKALNQQYGILPRVRYFYTPFALTMGASGKRHHLTELIKCYS